MPNHTQPEQIAQQRLLLKLMIGLALLFPQLAFSKEPNASPDKPQFAQDTFHSLLRKTIHAFGAEDYATATKLYAELKTTFGREKEYTADTIQITLLPAWGYACFMTEDYAQAIELFEKFLKKEKLLTERFGLSGSQRKCQASANDLCTAVVYRLTFCQTRSGLSRSLIF